MRRFLALPPDLAAGGVGAAAGLAMAAVGFGIGLPVWIALVVAGLGYAGTRLALTRVSYAPIDERQLADASTSLARDVVAEARIETRKLLTAFQNIREPIVRAHLMNLYTLGSKVAGEVERNPQRLGSVRRLLTYYLPAAARLGEGYRVLEAARVPDGARLSATATMIDKLHDTCARQADRLDETDVDGLDVELKLLGDALAEENRGRPAAPPPAALPMPGISMPDMPTREAVPVETSEGLPASSRRGENGR